MKYISTIILGSLLIIVLGIVTFRSKQVLDHPYDAEYWKTRYQQSQWFTPGSKHTIGDDGLYKYVGYELAYGRDPTTINAEMPPLAKSIIGWSIRYTGSAWLSAIVPYLFFVITIGILMFLISGVVEVGIFAALLSATDPLIAQQAFVTMLDSIQLMFLILMFVMLRMPRKSDFRTGIAFIIASGIFCGLFGASKFPALVPIAVIAGIISLTRISKKPYIRIALFLSIAACTYIASYVNYFIGGHSIMEWLRIQKWMINFYAISKLPSYFDSGPGTIFFGTYRNLFTGAWEQAKEWSPTWSIASVTILLFGIYLWIKRGKTVLSSIPPEAFWIILIGIYFLKIPFWPRYAILMLPFLYGFSMMFLHRRLPRIPYILVVIGMVGINMAYTFPILFPTPEDTVRQFTYDFEHRYFRDSAEHLLPESILENKKKFAETLSAKINPSTIPSIALSSTSVEWSTFTNPQTLNLTIDYESTAQASIRRQVVTDIVNANGVWKIVWNPNMLP